MEKKDCCLVSVLYRLHYTLFLKCLYLLILSGLHTCCFYTLLNRVLDSHLGCLLLNSWLPVYLGLWQISKPLQILLKIPAQFSVCRPQCPVSCAAVGHLGNLRCGLMAEGNSPQFGELSRDDLLSDVVLPRETWRQRLKFEISGSSLHWYTHLL